MKAHVISLFIIIVLLGSCKETCTECNGTGSVLKNVTVKLNCQNCDGTGWVKCNYTFKNEGFMSTTEYKCVDGKYKAIGGEGYNTGLLEGNYCSKCKGKGKIICPSCKGTGIISGSELRNVTCPKCKGEGKVAKN